MEKYLKSPLVLTSLRWDIDQLIKEPISGDYWWLKPLVQNGERAGITECCEYGYECQHHKDVRKKIECQKSDLS